ncbi:MAG: AAA family ATPase [Pirellulales bacterium]|nr:AAA family ATPase [Pirellulales bacterium]
MNRRGDKSGRSQLQLWRDAGGAPANDVWDFPEPLNVSAERAVLAALIYDAFWDDRLTAEHFGNLDHRHAVEAIDHLRHQAGVEISPHAVAVELERRGQLASFGGAPALLLLESETPSDDAFRHYVAELAELAERRRLRQEFRAGYRQASLRQYDLDDVRNVVLRALEPSCESKSGLLTASQLVAQHPTEAPPLIEGILRRSEVGSLVSSTKAGKSHLVLLLGLEVALGRPWLGRFAVTQSDVLFVDLELAPGTLSARLQQVCQELKVAPEQLQDRLQFLACRGESVDVHSVLARVRRLSFRPQLLILDPLYKLLPPDTHENDNVAVADVFQTLAQAAQRQGCAILVVHHASKGPQHGKAVTDVGSGAGSQSRAVDAHLVLRPHQLPDCAVLEGAVRSFAPFAPLVLRWQYPLWRPQEGLDHRDLRAGRDQQQAQQESRDRESDRKILEAAKEWVSHRQLKRETGFGDDRLNRGIARLKEAGRLAERSDVRRGNRCVVYQHADAQ